MSTRDLYEETINLMKDFLQDNISNFNGAYDTTINYFDSCPLFSITSRELLLLENINYYSNYQIRELLVRLCKQLAVEFGHQINDSTESSSVDFYELCDGEKIGYYLSMNEEYMPNIEEAIHAGMSRHVIVVVKNNLVNHRPNSHKYRSYPYKKLTRCITLEEFFDSVAPGEFEVFKEYIGQFNYDAEMMLGLIISPIPTKLAIQKKREKVIAEFEDFSYKCAFPSCFTESELAFLKERFFKCGILQLTAAPFIDSFVSSEWYFDLRASTDGEMEQTAIVAGYLKSIEQLLFALMLSRSDDLQFKLWTKKENKLAILTKDNQSDLLTMAGRLLSSIEKNYGKAMHRIYINEIIGNKVHDFLCDFFAHTRNGYFHKDNIYSFDDIKDIRKSAYCAFFLLGSSFLFDIGKIESAII